MLLLACTSCVVLVQLDRVRRQWRGAWRLYQDAIRAIVRELAVL